MDMHRFHAQFPAELTLLLRTAVGHHVTAQCLVGHDLAVLRDAVTLFHGFLRF